MVLSNINSSTQKPPPPTLAENVFVDSLVEQMNARFETTSTSILQKFDDVELRLESLEESIATIMDQAGLMVATTTPSSSRKNPRSTLQQQKQTSTPPLEI